MVNERDLEIRPENFDEEFYEQLEDVRQGMSLDSWMDVLVVLVRNEHEQQQEDYKVWGEFIRMIDEREKQQ